MTSITALVFFFVRFVACVTHSLLLLYGTEY